jgi:simple sugar transport system substrate-binding protein
VAQYPAKMGELGVATLVKAIRGEAVEPLVDTGAGLVTAENVKDFM